MPNYNPVFTPSQSSQNSFLPRSEDSRFPAAGSVPPGVVGQASLGTTTVSLYKTQDVAAKAQVKQYLLDAAKYLLPGEKRLQACMAAVVNTQKPFVSFDYADNVGKVRTKDICRCDNPWLCPNCGPIVAEEKARMVRQDMQAWKLAGFTSHFAVFTQQHFGFEHLADTDERIDQALLAMWNSRPGREFKAKWGISITQRSPDLTYNFKNGWHSHRNYIFYLERRALDAQELADFEAKLKALWVENCQAVGGFADLEHGCQVKGGDIFNVSDYIASKAMGCGGAGDDQAQGGQAAGPGRWGLPEELAKSHLKQARDGGFTPTGLLLAYLWDDNPEMGRALAGRLWKEYASVFSPGGKEGKGKRFVYTSPGGRKRLDELKEQYQDELKAALGEEEKPIFKSFVDVKRSVWSELVKFHLALLFISELAASQGDPAHVRAFLGEFLDDYENTDVYFPASDDRLPDWYFGDIQPGQADQVREFDQFMRDWNNQPARLH